MYRLTSLLLALALTGCRNSTPLRPEHLSPTQVAERAGPATVVILHEFEVKGMVHSMHFDEPKMMVDLREVVSSSDTQEQIMTKLFQVFLHDPSRYLAEGEPQAITAKFAVMGTGFIIAPDGYLVTNDHVVRPDKDEINKEALGAIHDEVEQDVDGMKRAMQTLLPGKTMTEDAANRLSNTLLEQYAKNAEFSYDQHLAVLMPSAEETKSGMAVIPAEVEKEGEPYPGKDIAILKIQGHDLPTLPLSSSVSDGTLQTGADIDILGYPGKVWEDDDLTLASRLHPSLSTGRVSDIKVTQKGWKVVQTETTINHGNSGGPVMNDAGEVIGVATFSETDSTGLNFAVDIDVAREFLAQLNVTPRESNFTGQYDAALDEYDRPAHGDALKRFQQLRESHPESVPVRDFLRQLSGNSTATPYQANVPASTASVSATLDDMPVPHRRSFNPVFLLLIPGLLLVVGIAVASSRR